MQQNARLAVFRDQNVHSAYACVRGGEMVVRVAILRVRKDSDCDTAPAYV